MRMSAMCEHGVWLREHRVCVTVHVNVSVKCEGKPSGL